MAHTEHRNARVSLKDIADELGISQTAVSFAINDRPGVSEETKRRVKEAAAKLGWSPVYAAQALGSSKTMTIGFAPSRASNGLQNETFMLRFMAGIHASLSPKGYGLLFRPCSSMREEQSVYRDWAKRKRVDGVVLVDLREGDRRPELVSKLSLPAVLAGGPDPSGLVPSLSIDDSCTMATILDHLTAQGHRRIAYLAGDAGLGYTRARADHLHAMVVEGLLESATVEFTDFDAAKAAAVTVRLLKSNNPPTAFVYETETLAATSLRAAANHLMKTGSGVFPRDLPAIVSFEDSFVCESSYPSITAVHRDAGVYGSKVANLLLKALRGDQVTGDRQILAPKLIVRESSASPLD